MNDLPPQYESTPRSGAGSRRCLVTGGAGFIGSHLVEHLLAGGDHVTIIDNCSTGRSGNLDRVIDHPRLRFVSCDLAEALSQWPEDDRFDEIYHLAAAVGVRLVVDDAIGAIKTNILQTIALFEFALRHGPTAERPAATLLASSSEVYGKAVHSPFSEEDDCHYGPTTAQRWSYACSKAIDEYLALAHEQRDRLPVVIIRFFNTVGPRQVGDYGMVLPSMVGHALRGEPIEVYGDGAQSRCFCDVRDVAPALPRVLRHPQASGMIFNIGSDRPITIDALAEKVRESLGADVPIRHIPYDEAYARGFEDLRQRRPDLTRIRRFIDFNPAIPLTKTIRDIAEHIRLHPARIDILARSKQP